MDRRSPQHPEKEGGFRKGGPAPPCTSSGGQAVADASHPCRKIHTWRQARAPPERVGRSSRVRRRRTQARRDGPKVPPTSRERGGVSEGGACPPLHIIGRTGGSRRESPMQQVAHVATSKGSARACGSIFPSPQTSHPGPKGWTEGPPNIQRKRGGFGRGGLPPLAHHRADRR